MRKSWPVWVVLGFASLFVAFRLARVGGDAVQLAEIGTRFSEGEANGSEGYDGQFVLYMAQDPRPLAVGTKLDVPAYRYQRILLPLAAWILAFGDPAGVGWSLIALNLLLHGLGTLAVVRILDHHDQWIGYALLYGLFVGVFAGIGADLLEPMAYGLVAIGLLLRIRGRRILAIVLLGLSLLAKETTMPFLAAVFIADLFGRRMSRLWVGYVLVIAGYAGWQVWLWTVFGEVGLGSGGANATHFEIIPFMGFLRVAAVDLRIFLAYLLIFGPGVILPAIWGVIRGIGALPSSSGNWMEWSVFLNALVIVALPFSTFREPLGLLRLAPGLALSALVLWSRHDLKRPLRYAWFWLVYLALLV